MKLSAHPGKLNYYPIARQNIKVFIDSGRTELKECISFDTATGEYTCYKSPLEMNNSMIVIIEGKDETLYYEIGDDVPQDLVDDWYEKETV